MRRRLPPCAFLLMACLLARPDAAPRAVLAAEPPAAPGASLPDKTKPSAAESPAVARNGAGTTTRMERVGNAEVLRVLSKGGSAYPVPGKILRYAERLLKKYDTNGDGVLDREELEKMPGPTQQMDSDRDGLLALPELARYIARYGRAHRLHLLGSLPQPGANDAAPETPLFQPTAARGALQSAPETILPDDVANMSEGEGEEAEEEEEVSPDGMPPEPSKLYPSGAQGKSLKKLRSMRKFYVSPQNQATVAPEWFRLRDLDGDGQLTLAEYAPHATQAELLEFARYDLDHDGILTLKEVARFGGAAGGSRAAASGTTTATAGAADASRAALYGKSSRGYGGATAAGAAAASGAGRATTVEGGRIYSSAPRSRTVTPGSYSGTR